MGAKWLASLNLSFPFPSLNSINVSVFIMKGKGDSSGSTAFARVNQL